MFVATNLVMTSLMAWIWITSCFRLLKLMLKLGVSFGSDVLIDQGAREPTWINRLVVVVS